MLWALTVLTFAAPEVLLEVLEKLRQEKQVESLTELTKDIHFYPDFHGMLTTVLMLDFSLFLQETGHRLQILA